MSKSSEELDLAIHTMTMAVNLRIFTKRQIEKMLVAAFNSLTISQINEVLIEHSLYSSWDDLDFAIVLKGK